MIKSSKTYTCLISGNTSKISYLQEQLELIENLSWYIFNLKQQFGINWWFNQKMLYHQCRIFFPELNSKVIQNFIRFSYSIKKGMKLPKKPVSPSIILDYQNFDFQINNSKLTNYWLRFQKKNFPLLGKRLQKIKHTDKIQLVQIYKQNDKFFCKLVVVKELQEPSDGTNVIGCDINYKRVVFSDNSFKSIKQLAHRKIEHKKHNLRKRNLNNYTKDFLHKLTTQIADELQQKAIEVLVLEDLRSLRKSASRKLGTSKGKMINYIVNSFPYSMFQNFLKYKCLDRGIKVEHINPAFTSKTCSKCGSRNTTRTNSKQDLTTCNDCNFHLSSDLNGSRNIEMKYTSLNGQLVNLALAKT
jgi:putative transposase